MDHTDKKISDDCSIEQLPIDDLLDFNQILKVILNHYRERFKTRFDNYLAYYKTIDLDKAIYTSSLGNYSLDKNSYFTWFHQETFIAYHGKEPLKTLALKLENLKSRIEHTNHFHSLYQLISDISINIKYIGPLTIYDTALRLGSHLNLNPDKIYLHSGAMTGFKTLINEKCDKEFVDKTVFRTIPRLYELDPKYLEDILCIYKKTFKAMKS